MRAPHIKNIYLFISLSCFGLSASYAQRGPQRTSPPAEKDQLEQPDQLDQLDQRTSQPDDADDASAPKASKALQNAVLDRPFIISDQQASLGGYFETQYRFMQTDGITEGPEFEFRRFNLFIFAPIGPRMRFLSELEFEHGTEEIVIENAQLDIECTAALILRGGILLTPIGAFNQRHDGPLWDFIDRPLVSTQLIPSTFSEVGFGAHGSLELGALAVDYQAYLTQGLNEGVISNQSGRVDLSEGKGGALFAEDSNQSPALSGRLGLRYQELAELGLSAWVGAYNTWELEELAVDVRRDVTLLAVDYVLSLEPLELRGEWAYTHIELPESLRGLLGQRQWGGYTDLVGSVSQFVMLDLPTTLQLGARVDYVDFNLDTLERGSPAGDETLRVTGSLSLRPGRETVFRLNYGRQWQYDLFGNPPALSGIIQVGVSSYF